MLIVLGNWSTVDQTTHRVDAVNDNAIDNITQQETLNPTLQEAIDSVGESPSGQC